MDPSRRQITKIARNASHFAQSQAKEVGLGASEYEVLHCIRKNPGICSDAFCRKLYREKSAVAHMVAGLERKGFVTRQPHPDDNRRRQIYATEKADSLKDSQAALEALYYAWLLEDIPGLVVDYDNEFEDIPEEEKRVFLQVLDTLYQKSKSERKTDYQTLSARVQEK